MRITGGELRGRRLAPNASPKLRPMLDQIRETIFNILFQKIEGARVLDAFAGTGIIGLECLSRKAAEIVYFEIHKPTAGRLQALLAEWNLEEKAKVFIGDFLQRDRLAAKFGPYDLIFLDPPYDHGLITPALATIVKSGLSADGGTVIARFVKSEAVTIPWQIKQVNERKFGDATVLFLTIDRREKVKDEQAGSISG